MSVTYYPGGREPTIAGGVVENAESGDYLTTAGRKFDPVAQGYEEELPEPDPTPEDPA